MVALEALRNTPDAARLVVTFDDSGADLGCRQRLSGTAPLDRKLQLGLLVEALNCARRVVCVVPEPVLVSVGVEDERALTELPLETVGVELGLLLPDARVASGALGFDESSGLPSSPHST